MDKILVIIFGILGMAFTYWFFLMKKDKEVIVGDSVDSEGSLQVDIIVQGGYSPEVISIPRAKTTKINFIRKDPSSCLEDVRLPDFSARGGSASGGKVRKYLPLNQKVTVELTPSESGEFIYSCGMDMYHGKIIVR